MSEENTNQTAAEETSMPSESMADYSRELEASFQTIKEGDILTGTVIGVSDTEVTLDLKYYTEGIIRLEDMSDDPSFSILEDVSTGDTISATVVSTDDGEGHILLSKKIANQVLAWETLNDYMKQGTNLTVKIGGVVNSGVIAYLEGIRGFIPASCLSLSYVENLDEWLFKELTVRVITVDSAKNKLVLSAKEILREQQAEEQKAKISNVKKGLVTEGVVESIKPYGAFVRLENGLSGLLHISQISTSHIKHPSVVLNEGDTVKVKIIDIKDGKLSLSMKALQDASAESIHEEVFELPKSESASTNLGDLFKNLKF